MLFFIAMLLSGGESNRGSNIPVLELFPFGGFGHGEQFEWLAFIQYPLYGLVVDLSPKKKIAALIVLALHVSAVAVVLLLYKP